MENEKKEKETKETKMTLAQKLMEIQKSIVSFANTDPSEKKDANGKNAYLYTPGWKITEHVRSQMDRYGIMLRSTLVECTHEIIKRNVYLERHGQMQAFERLDMYITLIKDYWWVDIATGEESKTTRQLSTGMNGLEKSMATAESLNQRYFLLNYFRWTTRDAGDESDANGSDDAQNIPENKGLITNKGAMAPQYGPQVQPVYEDYGQQPYTQRPARPEQPAQGQMDPGQIYAAAVNSAKIYAKNTDSYNKQLNKWLNILAANGFDTADPAFMQQLQADIEMARNGA